jgi:hypothetical protein
MMSDKSQWSAMYLGAIAALKISNVDAAAMLAALTQSDEEAIHVIGLMHAGREGDRVWPARTWLQKQRESQDAGECGERIDVRALSRALDTLAQHACTIDAALEADDHVCTEATNVRIAIRRIIDGFRSAETQEGS